MEKNGETARISGCPQKQKEIIPNLMETEFSTQVEIAISTDFRISEASEKLGKSELATSNGEESQRKSSDN
jgi:hypothetical protein